MHKNITKIKSLVTYGGIFSGYSFRGKISADIDGKLQVIQLKDIENDYTEIGNECIFIKRHKVKDKYYLKQGDILFTSKGANNYAIVYNPNGDIESVASSAFFVLRIDQEKAIPNYVAWFINQKKVQKYLESQATGTYTTSINRETIENISILLPSIEQQNKIAEIASLASKEQNLYTQLIENRSRLIQTQLLTTLKMNYDS